MTELKIGTRGSALALKQTEMVLLKLKAAYPEIHAKTIILTTGDIVTDRPLSEIDSDNSNGLFTHEFEQALKSGEIDMAVHSGKDLPSTLPQDFSIAAVLERGPVSDILVSLKETGISSIKSPAIGTSSPRRQHMAKELFPFCSVSPIRGNVPTRLDKLRSGQFDAIILAMAGIERLSIDTSDFCITSLSPDEFIPAASQGIIACETLRDSETAGLLRRISHSETMQLFDIERRIMALIGAGCHDAAGCYARKTERGFLISAFYRNSGIIRRECAESVIDITLEEMAGELLN